VDRPAKLLSRYVNLSYDLTVDEAENAVAETYRLFHGLNEYLVDNGFRPLEELILGNSLSGIVSEFLVKNMAKASTTLEANLKVGGHSDLLPKARNDRKMSGQNIGLPPLIFASFCDSSSVDV